MQRLIGIDFGYSRIGIASGQMITKTATPVAIVKADNGVPNWEEIDKIINQRKPNLIVVGLSLDAKNQETDMTRSTRQFADVIKIRYHKPVSMVSEAFSTREARWRLEEVRKKPNRHLKVDAFSACVILETWMSEN